MIRKVLIILFILVLALFGALWFLRWELSTPLPEATPGISADELARSIQASVGHDAWLETDGVEWVFRGSNAHVWDRRRGFVLVSWEQDGADDLVEAWFRLEDRLGIARRNGEFLSDEAGQAFIDRAWELWCNDSFWLNPIAKLFDVGTERGLVDTTSGRPGLLVTYTSGGVTPGDAYQWIVGSDDRPVAWRMWTQILPIPGLETTWEGWIQLASGAWISTRHQTPLGTLELTGVSSRTSAELVERFAPLERSLEARNPNE